MANLTVSKTTATPAQSMSHMDPLSAFREFMRWDPFREIAPLASMDRINEIDAPFEVKETKEGYLFKADVPGIKEQDIEVNITGNRLTIAGKRESEKEDKGETFYAFERSYGSFTRTFTLPDQTDGANIKAELKNGELTVVVPKTPAAVAKRITVATGDKPKA